MIAYSFTWAFSKSRPLCLALFLAMLLGCTQDRVAGGWVDTDSGPAIAGVILLEDGRPAAGARVLLRPKDFLGEEPPLDPAPVPKIASEILDDTCDSTGHFAFHSVDPGDYAIEARVGEGTGALLTCTVAGGKAAPVSLPPASVQPLGSIKGRVTLPAGVSGAVFVRIRGLQRTTLADTASGAFSFEDIPPGIFNLEITSSAPFIGPFSQSGVKVASGSATDIGKASLQAIPKQTFTVTGTVLSIPGADSTSPVILEYGSFNNPVDAVYLWAKASMGHVNLRGTIASYSADTGEAGVQSILGRCKHALQLARSSGMRFIPDPVAGARRKLALPPSGRFEDIIPDSTDGAMLLVREGRKASYARPVVFVSGTNLTTVANAFLIAPEIVDKIVVMGARNGLENITDSLATAWVAKRGRMVAWAREYAWDNTASFKPSLDAFPTNPIGEALRARYSASLQSSQWAWEFFRDFGSALYLFKPEVWRSAVGSDWVGPPMVAQAKSTAPFDFVDIPAEANDWYAMSKEFFATVAAAQAYHAWPVPGSVPAIGYADQAGIQVDSSAEEGDLVMSLNGTGSWAEYRLAVDSTTLYGFDVRIQSQEPVRMRFSGSDGTQFGSADLQASPEWGLRSGTVRLPKNVGRLRVDCGDTPCRLNWIRFKLP